MAITIKYDLLGSEQTLGIQSNRYDRATRRWYAEGIDNDKEGVGDAIEYIRNDPLVQFHQSNLSLPLQAITGTRVGLNNAQGILHYGRRYFNTVPTGVGQVSEGQSWSWSTDWYRRPYKAGGGSPFAAADELFPGCPAGAPNGDFQFLNGASPFIANADDTLVPVRWTWTQRAIRFTVPVVLSYNPLSRVAPFQDRINSGPVKFGGMRFEAYTLLSEGFAFRWEQAANGSVIWTVHYQFLHVSAGFLHQSVVFKRDPVTGFAIGWDAYTFPAYRTANFTNGFPST